MGKVIHVPRTIVCLVEGEINVTLRSVRLEGVGDWTYLLSY